MKLLLLVLTIQSILLLASNSQMSILEYSIDKSFKSQTDKIEANVDDVFFIKFIGDYIYSRPNIINLESINQNIKIMRDSFNSYNTHENSILMSESLFELKCIKEGEIVIKFSIQYGNDIFSLKSFFGKGESKEVKLNINIKELTKIHEQNLKDIFNSYQNEIKSNANKKLEVINKETDNLILLFHEERDKIERKNLDFNQRFEDFTKEMIKFQNNYFNMNDNIIDSLDKAFLNSYGKNKVNSDLRYCINFYQTFDLWYLNMEKNVKFKHLKNLL